MTTLNPWDWVSLPASLRSKTFRHDKYPIQVQCVSDHRAPEGGKQFDDILIDRSFPEDNAPTRKPRTGMLTKYIDNPDYDLAGSFVIGTRADIRVYPHPVGVGSDGRADRIEGSYWPIYGLSGQDSAKEVL